MRRRYDHKPCPHCGYTLEWRDDGRVQCRKCKCVYDAEGQATTNPVALCLEAWTDVVTELVSVLCATGLVCADDRERLNDLAAQAKGIQREFVDALHTPSPAQRRGEGEADG